MRPIDAALKLFLPLALACGLAARAEDSRPWASRDVAIVLYDGVEILDFAGPTEVFTAAGNGAFRVYTVAATKGRCSARAFSRSAPTTRWTMLRRRTSSCSPVATRAASPAARPGWPGCGR